ncbi:MAG: corrinoid protein [Theionarchaea archaeon]|nr:corrinoid protein [Theionarchaea archaeon]
MKEELFKNLTDAVLTGNIDSAVDASNMVIEEDIDAYEAIMKGCVEAMKIAGEKFEKNEIFVPELLISARAMNAAIDVLSPYLKAESETHSGKIVLGVVEGDIHDIGKNLVKLMLEVSGVEVVDLGNDVPVEMFIEKAQEVDADLIGLSALMTTSMQAMEHIVERAKRSKVKAKVIVGGAPVSQEFADRIQADGYASDAVGAARLARRLLDRGGQ